MCRWFRARRKESEVPKTVTRTLLRARLIDENVGDESYMPTNTIGIPIIVRQVIEIVQNALELFTLYLLES